MCDTADKIGDFIIFHQREANGTVFSQLIGSEVPDAAAIVPEDKPAPADVDAQTGETRRGRPGPKLKDVVRRVAAVIFKSAFGLVVLAGPYFILNTFSLSGHSLTRALALAIED